MTLHDFRRAADTFVAMDAPEKIGLIPGVLQHASPDVSDQHYNFARSMQAGRRFAAHLANARNRLRLLATNPMPTARQSRDQNGSDRDSTKSTLDQQNKTVQHRDRGEPSCA